MNATAKKILEIIRASNLATGIDISRYNVSADFDAAEFQGALEVIDYCMFRASYGLADGNIAIDPLSEKFYAELMEHPMIVRDAYHYLSSHSPWQKQYNKFLEAIDGMELDILTLDGEKIFNVKSGEFAGYAYYFLNQLIKDFPHTYIKFYSNRYDYQDWFDYYYDFDQFNYHHAQYPWSRWDNLDPYWLPSLYQTLTDIFTGVRKPSLPSSRGPNDYAMWQVGANTGLGYELGFGVDYLDINVSRLPIEEFRKLVGLYQRVSPSAPPMTVEERLDDHEERIKSLEAKA